MKTIGITGGIGAGKSTVLDYIKDNYNAHIIIADILAYELESPGGICYDSIVELLGSEILKDDGYIDKKRMASGIFKDPELLKQVNGIIHPAVKEHILSTISRERSAGRYDYLIVEAALLIEEGYESILDELWYVRTDPEIRRKRLKVSRGYSDEKIDSIFSSQLSDTEYAAKCKVIIDNSGNPEEAFKQIDNALSPQT
ncbi:MAG: dephospho-CoA kinase [Lachnospiraceae bacterium]|nr:dephospho-CoA kinase [Lachnospiraceae bacterium]